MPPDGTAAVDRKRELFSERLRRAGRTPFVFPPEYAAMQARVASYAAEGIAPWYGIASEGVSGRTIGLEQGEALNFSSYNYLGLSGHPEVAGAAKAAIDRYGSSASGSRLAAGERPVHRELERALAEFLGVDDALAFIGGFATNESVIGHLFGPGDLVIYDSHIHASVLGGAHLSQAAARPFPHNDHDALDRILAAERARYRQVLIVLEGVYSMDGGVPGLPRFIEIKRRHRALLMVDEAHSIGVLGVNGAGIGEHYGVERRDVEIWMGTLSKSLASCGGYIAGASELIDYLRLTTPGFVYSVGMTPASAAAALAALRIARREPQRVRTLRARSDLLRSLARERGLDTGDSQHSAVVPILVGDGLRCLRLYQALLNGGILALPVLFPAVAENTARLRLFISSLHTEEDIRRVVDAIAGALAAGSRD